MRAKVVESVLVATRRTARSLCTHRRGLAHRGSVDGRKQLDPLHLSYLATSYANLGQFDDAWRCIGEAISTIEATKEKRFEAEANRIAGAIALKSSVNNKPLLKEV